MPAFDARYSAIFSESRRQRPGSDAGDGTPVRDPAVVAGSGM